MGNKQLIKNSAELKLDIGNKDQDKIEGTKAKKIKQSQINTIFNNFNSNSNDFSSLLADIIKRIEKLEEKIEEDVLIKNNKFPKLYDYIPFEYFNFLKENGLNCNLVTDIKILKEYSEKRKANGVPNSEPIIFDWFPKAIIFIDNEQYSKVYDLQDIWENILEDHDELKYY